MEKNIKVAFDFVNVVKLWSIRVYSDSPPSNEQALELLDKLGLI